MKNLQYLEQVITKLRDIGIDDSNIESFAVSVIEQANEDGIPIVDILDKGLTRENITPQTIDAINRARGKTSYISIRKFNPEPSKFIKRNILD